MTLHTSEDSSYASSLKPMAEVNKYLVGNGLRDLVKGYEPAWFYFSPFIGMVYGQYLQRNYKESFKYERIILDDTEEGKLVLDVAPRVGDHTVKDGREKVVVLLHGVTGSTTDYYMKHMAHHLTQNGFNIVAVNHYGVSGEKDCRLMNFCK